MENHNSHSPFKDLAGNFRHSRYTGPNKPNLKKILKWIGLGFLIFIGVSIVLFATAIALLSINLPNVHNLDKLAVPQSTTIYDREGNVLYVKFGAENRKYIKLSQMSPNIIHATLAIEDAQFYSHPGFDLVGLVRAGLNDISGGPQQGGSTITQQYIKLTFLSSKKSIIRKIKELILAIRLEQVFSKNTILEKYLNKIPYGNNAYGIEKAAQTYFNKSAKDLTIAESAILASIPQNPSYYNPYGIHKYSKLAATANIKKIALRNVQIEANLRTSEIQRGLLGQIIKIGNNNVYIQGRADLVLKRMQETHYITQKEFNKVKSEFTKITFTKYRQSIKAPHFVMDIITQLENKYGTDIVEQGGLKVYTTIDPKMQSIAEKAISDRADNYEKKYNVKNEALVAMNPKNGEILAMVGSRDFFNNSRDGQLNITTSFRQPGSSFKPIVYAETFLKRYTPASVIFDVPTAFGTDTPKDYDGKFLGPISIRQALAQSRNIPAIKAYFLAGEQKPIIALAKAMGVVFKDETIDYGYPLALGSAETTLLSMTDAYATFADQGIQHNPVYILKVENSQGKILEQYQENNPGKSVLDPQIAYLITSILSDTQYRLGPNLTLNGRPNAAKTGTSDRKINNIYYPNDLLTFNYTPSLVVGVWAGNNNATRDGELSKAAEGYNVAGPIAKNFMDQSLKDTPVESFPIPDGIKQETVSKYNGKLASPLTPPNQQVSEFFASFSVPTEVDNSYQQIPNFYAAENLTKVICTANQKQTKNTVVYHSIDPARIGWENSAQNWLNENLPGYDQQSLISCSTASNPPIIKILSPNSNQTVNGTYIPVTINSSEPLKEAHYYLNNKLQNKVIDTPLTGTLRIPRGSTIKTYQITVRGYNKDGEIGQNQITINVK